MKTKSQFEVSLIYLCPSHLWLYRVRLTQPSSAACGDGETDATSSRK